MSDKRQFLYHTLIFGFGGILSYLAPLILFPLYTNYLSTGEYGIWSIIQRVAAFINTVLMIGGIRMAALTFFRQAKSEEERRRVAVTISLLLWLSVVGAILLAYLFARQIDLFLKFDNPNLLAFGLATSLLESLVIVPMTLTQARLESVRYVLTGLLMLLVRVGLCIYFVAWLGMGLYGVLLSQCFVSVTFSILLTLRELRIGSIKPDLMKWKDVLLFCWPFVPTGFIWMLYLNSDWYFLINFGPYDSSDSAKAAVGLYTLAFTLMSFTEYACCLPMRQVWSAQMYDVHKLPDAKDRFGHFALRIIFAHLFFVLGVCMFAPELIRTVCDSSYFPAASLIPIAGILSCINLFASQAESTFYITKKTYYKPINNAAVLPCIIVLLYWLVPRYGIIGAAIASTLAMFINCALIYFITQRLFAVRYPFKRLAVLIGLAIACYFLSTFFGGGIDASSLTKEQFDTMTKWDKLADALVRIRYIPFLWKACCMLLWLGLVWISGVLLKEDKEMVVQALRKVNAKFLPQKS